MTDGDVGAVNYGRARTTYSDVCVSLHNCTGLLRTSGGTSMCRKPGVSVNANVAIVVVVVVVIVAVVFQVPTALEVAASLWFVVAFVNYGMTKTKATKNSDICIRSRG